MTSLMMSEVRLRHVTNMFVCSCLVLTLSSLARSRRGPQRQPRMSTGDGSRGQQAQAVYLPVELVKPSALRAALTSPQLGSAGR